MRLAFLTHEPFFPPSGGGSAEALYLVEEMVRRGHEVHLFCPRVADPADVEARFKVRLHPFTLWKMGRYAALRNAKYLLYPFFLERLVARAARAARFDLVFSQHAIAAVAAGRLKRALGVPVVMNFLDYLTAFMEAWPAYIAPPPAVAALKRFELALPLRYQADGVLTVSDTLADYFAGTGYARSRIQPIYFGYDSTLFPLRAAPPSGPPVIVMHGSLDQHHLQRIAVEAVATVARARPEVVFRFVGQQTATLDRFLKGVRTLAPQARLECAGFVSYEKIHTHLAAATVGMVPYEESTGTHCAFVAKIVEYLGVGLPVVSTPLQSAARYFKEEPMVRFSKFDGATFAADILATIDHPPTGAAAAAARVREQLDWRAITRRALDFTEAAVRTAA